MLWFGSIVLIWKQTVKCLLTNKLHNSIVRSVLWRCVHCLTAEVVRISDYRSMTNKMTRCYRQHTVLHVTNRTTSGKDMKAETLLDYSRSCISWSNCTAISQPLTNAELRYVLQWIRLTADVIIITQLIIYYLHQHLTKSFVNFNPVTLCIVCIFGRAMYWSMALSKSVRPSHSWSTPKRFTISKYALEFLHHTI